MIFPPEARKTVATRELDRHFTGVALELSPAVDFDPLEIRTRVRLRDLWSRLTGYGGALFQLIALSLVLQATVLVAPLFLQLVVDEAVAQGDTSLLLVLFLGFGFVYALNAVVAA